MKHEKSCGTIIISHGKVLLIGAKDNDGKMFWSFPKGHQEPGETDIETALRETSEEVSLNVKISDQTPIIVSHPIHGRTAIKDIYLFLVALEGDEIEPRADEVECWRWVDFNKVDSYLMDYYKNAWNEAKSRVFSLSLPHC